MRETNMKKLLFLQLKSENNQKTSHVDEFWNCFLEVFINARLNRYLSAVYFQCNLHEYVIIIIDWLMTVIDKPTP